MKIVTHFSISFVLSLWWTGINLASAAQVDSAHFDFNRNGLIDPGVETTALVDALNLPKQPKKMSKIVRNNPKKIMVRAPTEAPKAPAIAEKYLHSGGFYLGRSLDEPDLLTDGIEVLNPKDGALFQYKYDFQNSTNVLSATGAAYFGILTTANSNDSSNNPSSTNVVSLNSGWLVGSSFDVARSSDPTKDLDELNFFGGYQAIAAGGPIDANIFRFWASHDGDTEFKSSVLSAKAEWYPYNFAPIPLNVPQNILGGLIRYSPKLSLNSQISTVLAAGDKTELASKDSIYGVGSIIGLDFWMFPNVISTDGQGDRTPFAHASIQYSNAIGHLSGQNGYQGLLTAEGDIYLGSKNVALSVVYNNGIKPYSGESLDNVTVGLSVLVAP